MSSLSRSVLIGTPVVGLHLLALWGLQVGLVHREREPVRTVTLLAARIETDAAPPGEARPAPPAPPAPAVTPAPVPMVARQLAARPAPALAAPAEPAAPAQTVAATARNPLESPTSTPGTPSDPGPTGAPPQPASPRTTVAPTGGSGTSRSDAPTVRAPGPAAMPPAAAKIELPLSDAAYLQNPRPTYPAMSKRLREEGEVVVNVFIGIDGLAQRTELRQSSGYERLDRVAVETVLRWRYVPGKRGGVAEAMWVEVPLLFKLDGATR